MRSERKLGVVVVSVMGLQLMSVVYVRVCPMIDISVDGVHYTAIRGADLPAVLMPVLGLTSIVRGEPVHFYVVSDTVNYHKQYDIVDDIYRDHPKLGRGR
jgi:hypothetical protein